AVRLSLRALEPHRTGYLRRAAGGLPRHDGPGPHPLAGGEHHGQVRRHASRRATTLRARYATGYLADINAAPDPTPMDFSAFLEVYLGGKWWPLDARHNVPRIGRVLMARGRGAGDVALATSF